MAERPRIRRRLYFVKGSSLYALVCVWPTRRSLVAHCRSLGLAIPRGGAGGCCVTERRTGRRVCTILLCERQLGFETVAHEFLHATLSWGRRVGFNFASLGEWTADEEPLTVAHGKLCYDFVCIMRAAE